MRDRWLRAALLVLTLCAISAPAAAHDGTGHEEDEQTLECPAPGEPVPANQEPPSASECDEPGETTYQGYVWDNDVSCHSGGTDVAGAKVYVWNDLAMHSAGAGACNEGAAPVPVQGRAVTEVGYWSGWGTLYVDGDKDNTPEQAQGFARVDAGRNGAGVRCGDEGGKLDASDPGEGDSQGDCG